MMKGLSLSKLRNQEGGAIFYIRKYWFVFFVIAIFATSLWLRLLPSRFNELIGLDEFHVYRIAEYALHHNLQIPSAENLDMMRYSPYGVNTWEVDYALPSYLPVFLYLFVSAIGISMPFFEFAIIIPAFLGAIGTILAFFIAKEIYGSNLAGIFAAFFVSLTPSLFTRTSGASFEKEAAAVIFMFLATWLFLRSYKKSSWIYGILAGVSLGIMGITWGGVQYMYLLLAAFLGAIFIGNIALVGLNYLFPGHSFKKALDGMERIIGPPMIKAYLPTTMLGIIISTLTPHSVNVMGFGPLLTYVVLGVLLIRYGAVRFNVVKKEYVHYIIPGLVLVGAVVFLFTSMLTDVLDGPIGSFIGMMSLSKGVVGTTVAENAPGDWGTILSTLGTSFSSGTIPQLSSISPLFALWIFMSLGIFLLAYEFYRTQNWMLILPLIWIVSSIWGVFYQVRLLFLLGPFAGIAGAYFFGWSAVKIRGLKFIQSRRNVKILTYAAVIILVSLLVVINVATTFAYAISITPAICFPMYNNNNPFDVTPCVVVDDNGTQVLHTEGQPWYQGMDFLSKQTPQDSVILSWWDFGYWFQTRGNRTSVADGGNLGGKYFRNYELADWYTDKAENWSGWEPWMKFHDVDYVFMDYTLVGKYGAITTIASRGENPRGFLEFRQSAIYPRDNTTIVEYTSTTGPYAVWLPMSSEGGLTAAPTFLVTQNGKYYQKTTVNDVCTTSGIIRVGNDTNAMPGCIAISDLGIFYIPEEDEHNIFVALMFMKGYGLPVEKVFDNTYIQIYKVNYGNETVSSA